MNGAHSIVIGSEDTKNCPTSGWAVFNNVKSVDPNAAPWTNPAAGRLYVWLDEQRRANFGRILDERRLFCCAEKRCEQHIFDA